jgi:hypothetical protein
MQKKWLWAVIALSAFFLQSPRGVAAAPAHKTVGIDDGNVMPYAARMRMTKGTWDYLKITLRDTFSRWDYAGGDGFNLLLDSGYNALTHAAGPIRTTPFEWDWGYYDSQSLPGANQECLCYWNSCACASKACGVSCGGWGWNGAGWIQVRRPGFNAGDTPQPPWQCLYYGFQEYGFYIPATGTPSTGGPCPSLATYYDFQEFQACSSYFSYDAGTGKAGRCTTAGMDLVVATLEYNVRIFIYPNMRQENGDVLDPIDNWNPASVATRGPYANASWNNVRYSQITNCNNGGTCSAGSGSCCDTICTCGSWGVCSYTNRQTPNCNAFWTANYNSHFGSLPQTIAAYDPAQAYSQTQGTYFRAGDDTAVYLNIYQMQIQSNDRGNAYKPPACGLDRFYTGLVGGVPNYLTDNQQVRNCMRPKMYWYDDPLNPLLSKWKQCEPFDTWNADGTLNAANDDDKWLYPGNPATGKGADNVTQVSPGRCGRQNCTWGVCNSSASGWAWAAGSRTANLDDIVSDNDGQTNPYTGRLRGTGWYGLKLEAGYPVLNPGSNRIDIRFTGKDLRLEMAAEADVHASVIGINIDVYNNVVVGRLLVDQLAVNASLYLYSIDSQSCTNAYPNSCSGSWSGVNTSNLMDGGSVNPDKLVIDAVINSVSITPGNGGAWYQGSTSCIFNWPWPINGCAITMQDILNNSLIQGQLLPPIEGAVQDALKGALGSISSAVPNLNGILGNPINMGTALIDSGIFIAASSGSYQLVNPPNPYPRKWPVYVTTGPTAARNAVDMRMAVGFKPIAFKMPMGANGVMDIDTNDPPLATSVYGIPELWKAATRGPGGVGNCPTSTAADTCPGGVFTPGPGCALPAHDAYKDPDQVHDADDYCRGRPGSTLDAWYFHPKTGTKTYVPHPYAIPDFWKGPISKFNKPPDWCMTVGASGLPRTLRTGATPADFANLYPRTTWLSFDGALDKDPATNLAVPQNTIGGWDQMPGNSVLQQGTYTTNGNTGALDPNPMTYDFSMHLHQRLLNEFAQTVFASGIACLEFAAQDTLGADTPWKDLLASERFAGFLPEVATLFPGKYVKIRIMPTQMARIRVGMGNLNFTPLSRFRDPVNGALPITNQPYTLSAAVPDLQVQVLAPDKATGVDVPLLTFKWNTVVGFYAKAVRQCYYLEGLTGFKNENGQLIYSGDDCRSPYPDKRRVSGYYELFLDMNGQTLNRNANGELVYSGTNKLGDAWELPADARDGFADGRFTNAQWACPECVPSVPSGTAMFEVTQNYCSDHPTACRKIGISAAIPAILSSTLQAFLVTRLNFYNLTIDFLYVGPDGPNDDGLGTAAAYPFNHIDGDYLGIYARFLGDLNVFGLLDTAALLAPKPGKNYRAQVELPETAVDSWVRSAYPVFDVKLNPLGKLDGQPSVASYTYSLDNGFWHTPVDFEKLPLEGLTEGRHALMLRTFEDSLHASAANLTPVVLNFTVDTVAPAVTILPSKEGTYRNAVRFELHDLQTPADQLKAEFQWDDGDWAEAAGLTASVRGLPAGRHVLRVRATDLAGNTGSSAREVVVSGSGWGCAAGGSGAAWPVLFALALLGLGALRRRAGA